MKTDLNTDAATSIVSTTAPADSAKLVSLLALATGAIAIPQTSNADIIFTDLSSSPVVVGFGGAASYLFNDLPGTVQFGFERFEVTTSTYPYGVFTITYRTVVAGQLGGAALAGVRGAANGFAVPLAAGANWNNGAGTFYSVAVGTASNYDHRPTSGYEHNYIAWVFTDTTQGNALRYGWIDISLSIGNVTGPPSGPNVTLWGYA